MAFSNDLADVQDAAISGDGKMGQFDGVTSPHALSEVEPMTSAIHNLPDSVRDCVDSGSVMSKQFMQMEPPSRQTKHGPETIKLSTGSAGALTRAAVDVPKV